METLVVNQPKNHQYMRAHYGFSRPTSHFRGINCRSFQSGMGILPTPFRTYTTHETHATPQRTQSRTVKTVALQGSSPIPVNIPKKVASFDDEFDIMSENLPFYEHWAGPTYSNSPPPSSLPIPKFSMRPKSSVSSDLPDSDSDIEVHHLVANCASASLTRDHPSVGERFLGVDCATETLRRILNLDMRDNEI